MAVLDHLEPKNVFHFFEELCAIPHGSSNTKQISDWLLKFAEDRGLEAYQDELLELPKQIDELNIQLMLITMDCCYETMQENTEEIEAIGQWVTDIRIELKKRLIRKQEMEQRNQAIYAYMHDVFGAEVIDMFDMQYQPDAKKKDTN